MNREELLFSVQREIWGQVLHQHIPRLLSFPDGTPSQTRTRRRSLSRHYPR